MTEGFFFSLKKCVSNATENRQLGRHGLSSPDKKSTVDCMVGKVRNRQCMYPA